MSTDAIKVVTDGGLPRFMPLDDDGLVSLKRAVDAMCTWYEVPKGVLTPPRRKELQSCCQRLVESGAVDLMSKQLFHMAIDWTRFDVIRAMGLVPVICGSCGARCAAPAEQALGSLKCPACGQAGLMSAEGGD